MSGFDFCLPQYTLYMTEQVELIDCCFSYYEYDIRDVCTEKLCFLIVKFDKLLFEMDQFLVGT